MLGWKGHLTALVTTSSGSTQYTNERIVSMKLVGLLWVFSGLFGVSPSR